MASAVVDPGGGGIGWRVGRWRSPLLLLAEAVEDVPDVLDAVRVSGFVAVVVGAALFGHGLSSRPAVAGFACGTAKPAGRAAPQVGQVVATRDRQM